MTDLSLLQKGDGYPTLEVPFGYNGLQTHLRTLTGMHEGNLTIGVVRKYGITKERAIALLNKMARNEYTHGWVIAVNPRSGRDEQSIAALLDAYRDPELPTATRRYFRENALCIVHVTQPEGSPNSWTAGLSGPIVTLMSMVPREHWGRVLMFSCSGETLIDDREMSKFDTVSAVPPLTYRRSPLWLNPGLDAYQDENSRMHYCMAVTLDRLQIAMDTADPSELAPYDIARLVPLWRNTGRTWRLSDFDTIGLFDRRCNAGQGMEDWLQMLIWMTRRKQDLGSDYQPISSLQILSVVAFDDERVLAADNDASLRPSQVKKFDDECAAWIARFTMFCNAGSPASVPTSEQEFLIPVE